MSTRRASTAISSSTSGKVSLKSTSMLGDDQIEGRPRHGKAQGTGGTATSAGCVLRGLPELFYRRSGREQIVVADVCQADAARRAAKKRRPETLLKTSDRLANRGWRNAQAPGGFREATCFRHRDEHGYAIKSVSVSQSIYLEVLLQASCRITALIARTC